MRLDCCPVSLHPLPLITPQDHPAEVSQALTANGRRTSSGGGVLGNPAGGSPGPGPDDSDVPWQQSVAPAFTYSGFSIVGPLAMPQTPTVSVPTPASGGIRPSEHNEGEDAWEAAVRAAREAHAARAGPGDRAAVADVSFPNMDLPPLRAATARTHRRSGSGGGHRRSNSGGGVFDAPSTSSSSSVQPFEVPEIERVLPGASATGWPSDSPRSQLTEPIMSEGSSQPQQERSAGAHNVDGRDYFVSLADSHGGAAARPFRSVSSPSDMLRLSQGRRTWHSSSDA